MAQPFPVQEAYIGFMRDLPRYQLPGGILWDMLDWFPQLDGAARARYGWSNLSSNTFAGAHGGAPNAATSIGFHPPSSLLIVCDHAGNYYSLNPTGGALTYLSTPDANPCFSRPVWHRNFLTFFRQGLNSIQYVGGGSSVGSVGTSPHAKVGTLYGDYTVAANDGGSDPQRAWFSNAGDPSTWDTTNSWIDLPGAVNGCQGIRNALLFFTADQVWRVRGDTPPQTTVVGNLVKDHLYDTGIIDERSIAVYGETVIWANSEGVWFTNGATVNSLTDAGGISTYYHSQIAANGGLAALAGGIIRSFYVLSITYGNNSNETLVCDLSSKGKYWIRLSNINAFMYAHRTDTSETLSFIDNTTGYAKVGELSSMWNTGSTTDGNGTEVLPVIETPMYRGWMRFHRKYIPTNTTSVWKRLYVNHEIGFNSVPGLQAFYTTDPEVGEPGSPYTSMGNVPLNSSNLYGPYRGRMFINPNGGAVPAHTIGFKIAVLTGRADDIRLGDLELEYDTREGNR